MAVDVEVTRSGRSRHLHFLVDSGTEVRAVVRLAGESPEGCAVLCGETPLPLDSPIDSAIRLTVVPSFSGG